MIACAISESDIGRATAGTTSSASSSRVTTICFMVPRFPAQRISRLNLGGNLAQKKSGRVHLRCLIQHTSVSKATKSSLRIPRRVKLPKRKRPNQTSSITNGAGGGNHFQFSASKNRPHAIVRVSAASLPGFRISSHLGSSHLGSGGITERSVCDGRSVTPNQGHTQGLDHATQSLIFTASGAVCVPAEGRALTRWGRESRKSPFVLGSWADFPWPATSSRPCETPTPTLYTPLEAVRAFWLFAAILIGWGRA